MTLQITKTNSVTNSAYMGRVALNHTLFPKLHFMLCMG